METNIVKLEGRVDTLEGDIRELAQKQEQHDSRITEMERTTITPELTPHRLGDNNIRSTT